MARYQYGTADSPKQQAKNKRLFDRLTAGGKVRESEYPSWQKAPRPAQSWNHSDSGGCLADYLLNKGITEDEANPAAIYWAAYQELELGHSCEVCGRPGPAQCGPCEEWSKALLAPRKPSKSTATAQDYSCYSQAS